MVICMSIFFAELSLRGLGVIDFISSVKYYGNLYVYIFRCNSILTVVDSNKIHSLFSKSTFLMLYQKFFSSMFTNMMWATSIYQAIF